MITSPICFSCRWLNDKPNENDDLTCRAFPRGIPQEILDGYDHTRPYPGDSGVVFESLETVSANQKSLDGVSNRPDDSGDPLDLLEGSERVRKYNPYHDRLGRFATSGGAPTLTEDDYARAEELFARVDMNAFGADPALQLIQDERGRLAPTVLDAEAFDKYEGETLYRGVRPEKVRPKYDQNDPWGLSAKTESYEFMRGELDGSSPYTGFGVHGNGLYFTPDVKIAKTFAAPIDPVIFRAKVSTSAKIIDYETLQRLSQEAASRGGRGGRLLADPGRLAAFLGFDGYSLFGDATGTRSAKQVVIVNRAALVWDKSVFDSALGAAKKNWGLKFNPNHDRLGRFATTGGSGSFSDLESIEGVVPLDSVGDWEDEVVTSDLTDAQDMSVRYYVGRGYSEINGNLRGGPKPFNEAEFWGNLQDAGGKELVRNVKNLDAATKKHKLKKDTTVFRGVTGDGWDLKRWEDRGFTSTSLSPTVAGSFGNVVMAINLPKGTKGYAHLGMNGEYEFLLPRNMKYKLVDKPVKVKLDGKDVTVLTATLA